MSYLIFEIRCVIYTFLAHLSADGATFQEARWPHVASGYCMSQSFSRRKQIPTGHPDGDLGVTGVTPPSGAQLRRWCQSALNLCLIIVSGPFGPLSCFITVVVILSSFSPLPDIIFPFLSGKPPQGCGMPRNAGATPGARVRGSNLWTEGRRGLANGNQGAVLPAVGTAAGRGKRGALDLSSRLTSAPLSWHLLLEPWTLCFRLPTSLPGEPFSAS